MELDEAFRRVSSFREESLKEQIAQLENDFRGLNRDRSEQLCASLSLTPELIEAAGTLKRMTAQIDVIIHAIGILRALPAILEEDERVQQLSLGAGNTGKDFDLETDRRVAEFKFIHWKGGPETIRKNNLFKDFFYLAEAESTKRRYLYVLGLKHPMKFLEGGRDLSSVMSRNKKLAEDFESRYGGRFETVAEYFAFKRDSVSIVDISPILPGLV